VYIYLSFGRVCLYCLDTFLVIAFSACVGFHTQELAHMLESLNRVSKRVEWNHFVAIVPSGRCRSDETTTQQARSGAPPTTRPHCKITVLLRVLFGSPEDEIPCPQRYPRQRTGNYTQGIARDQIKTQSATCHLRKCRERPLEHATISPRKFGSILSPFSKFRHL
jgi:hypothetical protein